MKNYIVLGLFGLSVVASLGAAEYGKEQQFVPKYMMRPIGAPVVERFDGEKFAQDYTRSRANLNLESHDGQEKPEIAGKVLSPKDYAWLVRFAGDGFMRASSRIQKRIEQLRKAGRSVIFTEAFMPDAFFAAAHINEQLTLKDLHEDKAPERSKNKRVTISYYADIPLYTHESFDAKIRGLVEIYRAEDNTIAAFTTENETEYPFNAEIFGHYVLEYLQKRPKHEWVGAE